MAITRIQVRRGTTAQWAAANSVLANGEPGMDTDTEGWKLGDGTTPWATLPWKDGAAMSDAALATAVDTGATKAKLIATYVGLVGGQDVAGVKNFTSTPTVNGVAVGVGASATTDASQLTTGTLADARLPAGSNAATIAAKATTASVTAEAATARAAEAKINGVAVTGVPSVGQVPTATSGTASTWQTPAAGGGGGLVPTSKTGFWLTPFPHTSTGSSSLTQSRLDCVPLLIQKTVTLNSLGLRVTVSAAATTIRLGLYADDGTGYPGALMVDAGTVDATGNGDKTIAISQVLTPGLYWLGSAAQGGSPQTVAITNLAVLGMPFGSVAAGSAFDGNPAVAFSQPGVTGALPSTFTATQTVNNIAARVFAKVA